MKKNLTFFEIMEACSIPFDIFLSYILPHIVEPRELYQWRLVCRKFAQNISFSSIAKRVIAIATSMRREENIYSVDLLSLETGKSVNRVSIENKSIAALFLQQGDVLGVVMELAARRSDLYVRRYRLPSLTFIEEQKIPFAIEGKGKSVKLSNFL